MIKYYCTKINLEFAFFDSVVESFIGQKVLIKCDEIEIFGFVDNCTLEQTRVKIFGDVSGFILSKTIGNFYDCFVEMPLSPSILGRKLDFFGNPLDELPPIIPITKTADFYLQPKKGDILNSEIVSENDWLIKSQEFNIQKGQVKACGDLDLILPLLGISNLSLLILELDSKSKQFKNLPEKLETNNLDKITIWMKSINQNDISIAPFCVSQVVKYLSAQLGFDVLILVSNSQLLDNNHTNNFYFASTIDQLASFDVGNSVTVIKI
jgi:hypothetical protein